MMEEKNIPIDRSKYNKMTREERLQSFKRTVAHPHLETSDKALREAIQETGGASLVNVYGLARVGKSTMKNHVIRPIRPTDGIYNVKLSIASAGSLRRRPRLFSPALSGSYATIDCIFCLFVLLSQLQQRLHVVYFVGGPNRS